MSVEYSKDHPIPAPTVHQDNEAFWEAVKNNELVFQRCTSCGRWRHPPRPMCPECRSLEKEWVPSTGKGTVFSRVTVHEADHPGFRTPYAVILVEMEEGVRLVSNLVGAKPEDIRIGMPVEVVFDRVAEEITLPKFKMRA